MAKMKFAVIGNPIGHTMSPFINKKLFEFDNTDASYEIIEVESIEENLEKLKDLNGFNITIPHKKNIIPYLDEISPKAKLCGSVNTVLVKDGKFSGTSTDGLGMRLSLESHGLGFNEDVLLLGNGGAARAVAFEAVDYAKSITVAARNITAAKEFVNELKAFAPEIKIDCCDIKNIPSKEFDLLINTTSVGMYPNSDFSPVDESVIENCKAVYDAVYNPHDTLLIKKAQSLNKKCIHGMEMLVNQAAAAHEFWLKENFKPYNKEDIEKLTEASVKEMMRVFYGEN